MVNKYDLINLYTEADQKVRLMSLAVGYHFHPN